LASVERRCCSNEAKTRNPLKFAGVPQTHEPIAASGRSSHYCEDIWRRYCCLTSFFPIDDTYLSCGVMARQSSATARRWRIFGDFLRPVFSALHPKFALRPHRVWKYGRQDIQSATLRIGQERKKKTEDRRYKKKPQDKNIMACPIP